MLYRGGHCPFSGPPRAEGPYRGDDLCHFLRGRGKYPGPTRGRGHPDPSYDYNHQDHFQGPGPQRPFFPMAAGPPPWRPPYSGNGPNVPYRMSVRPPHPPYHQGPRQQRPLFPVAAGPRPPNSGHRPNVKSRSSVRPSHPPYGANFGDRSAATEHLGRPVYHNYDDRHPQPSGDSHTREDSDNSYSSSQSKSDNRKPPASAGDAQLKTERSCRGKSEKSFSNGSDADLSDSEGRFRDGKLSRSKNTDGKKSLRSDGDSGSDAGKPKKSTFSIDDLLQDERLKSILFAGISKATAKLEKSLKRLEGETSELAAHSDSSRKQHTSHPLPNVSLTTDLPQKPKSILKRKTEAERVDKKSEEPNVDTLNILSALEKTSVVAGTGGSEKGGQKQSAARQGDLVQLEKSYSDSDDDAEKFNKNYKSKKPQQAKKTVLDTQPFWSVGAIPAISEKAEKEPESFDLKEKLYEQWRQSINRATDEQRAPINEQDMILLDPFLKKKVRSNIPAEDDEALQGTNRRDDEELDSTVQNILQSLGFNFDLSKRMKELARQKKQQDMLSTGIINKSATFLGSVEGLAHDVRTALFNAKQEEGDIESLIKEARASAQKNRSNYDKSASSNQKVDVSYKEKIYGERGKSPEHIDRRIDETRQQKIPGLDSPDNHDAIAPENSYKNKAWETLSLEKDGLAVIESQQAKDTMIRQLHERGSETRMEEGEIRTPERINSPIRDDYNSRSYTRTSPDRYKSRSPLQCNSRSPGRRISRSPNKQISRSPSRRISRSLSMRISRSPSRQLSRCARQIARSPGRQISRLPGRKISPSRRISRSPRGRISRSPGRRISRYPVRRMSKSPGRQRSRRSERYRSCSRSFDRRRKLLDKHLAPPARGRHPSQRQNSNKDKNQKTSNEIKADTSEPKLNNKDKPPEQTKVDVSKVPREGRKAYLQKLLEEKASTADEIKADVQAAVERLTKFPLNKRSAILIKEYIKQNPLYEKTLLLEKTKALAIKKQSDKEEIPNPPPLPPPPPPPPPPPMVESDNPAKTRSVRKNIRTTGGSVDSDSSKDNMDIVNMDIDNGDDVRKEEEEHMRVPKLTKPLTELPAWTSLTALPASTSLTELLASTSLTELPAWTSLTELLAWTSRTALPAWTSRTALPAWTSQTGLPAWTSQTVLPAWTSQTVLPASTSRTVSPAWTSQTVLPASTSRTVSPAWTSQTVLPASTSQTVLPASASQTMLPASASQTMLPRWTSQTVLPAWTSQTMLPRWTSRTVLPASTSQTALPAWTSQTMLPRWTSRTVLPASTSQTALPAWISQTGLPAWTSQTMLPRWTSQTMLPRWTSQTGLPAWTSRTVLPASTSQTVLPASASQTMLPASASQTVLPASASRTVSHKRKPNKHLSTDKGLMPETESTIVMEEEKCIADVMEKEKCFTASMETVKLTDVVVEQNITGLRKKKRRFTRFSPNTEEEIEIILGNRFDATENVNLCKSVNQQDRLRKKSGPTVDESTGTFSSAPDMKVICSNLQELPEVITTCISQRQENIIAYDSCRGINVGVITGDTSGDSSLNVGQDSGSKISVITGIKEFSTEAGIIEGLQKDTSTDRFFKSLKSCKLKDFQKRM